MNDLPKVPPNLPNSLPPGGYFGTEQMYQVVALPGRLDGCGALGTLPQYRYILLQFGYGDTLVLTVASRLGGI